MVILSCAHHSTIVTTRLYYMHVQYHSMCALYREELAHRAKSYNLDFNGKTMVPLRPLRYNFICSLTDMLEITEA